MDQNQPLKKRSVEQPSTSSNQPQKIYVKAISVPSPNQGQLYQFIPIDPKEGTPNQPNQEDGASQGQPMPLAPQPTRNSNSVSPMLLNIWTQTDDLQSPPSSLDSCTKAELIAHVEELRQSLKTQADIFNEFKKQNATSPSPERIIPAANKIITSEIKHEGKTYRILNTANDDANSDTQIEIQLSDDADSDMVNLDNSPTSVYTLHTSPAPQSPEIQNEEAATPSPKASQQGSSSKVSIGPNGTKISAAEFEKISWTSASIATRKLLRVIFDRETLATHSMTGKASPAFKDLDKPVKGRLEPNAIQDIVHIVSNKCNVSAKEVRSAITTKCADENKMLKLKELKRLNLQETRRSALSEINKQKKKESNKEN